MEYYSAIKRNASDSVIIRWMNLEPIIQSEVSKKTDKYRILMHIYGIEGASLVAQMVKNLPAMQEIWV